jgi:hypothetical protein
MYLTCALLLRNTQRKEENGMMGEELLGVLYLGRKSSTRFF